MIQEVLKVVEPFRKKLKHVKILLSRENQGNLTINRSIFFFLADLKSKLSTYLLKQELFGLKSIEG